MRAGRPPQMLVSLFKEAMQYFEEAETLHPTGNDDAVLRWNRCIRLLEKLPQFESEEHHTTLEDADTAPVGISRGTVRKAG